MEFESGTFPTRASCLGDFEKSGFLSFFLALALGNERTNGEKSRLVSQDADDDAAKLTARNSSQLKLLFFYFGRGADPHQIERAQSACVCVCVCERNQNVCALCTAISVFQRRKQ